MHIETEYYGPVQNIYSSTILVSLLQTNAIHFSENFLLKKRQDLANSQNAASLDWRVEAC